MLTAGQQAVEQAIAKAGLTPADIDVFEFAGAFSALCLTFRRDLDAGPDRMNPNGGTIAMGHAFRCHRRDPARRLRRRTGTAAGPLRSGRGQRRRRSGRGRTRGAGVMTTQLFPRGGMWI